jgi:hypothetical protein
MHLAFLNLGKKVSKFKESELNKNSLIIQIFKNVMKVKKNTKIREKNLTKLYNHKHSNLG